MLLLTVISHALLATVFLPRDSDLPVYERDAAAVATAIQVRSSFSVARDRIIRDEARRKRLPEPTTDDLLIEYPPLAVIWTATIGIGLELDADPGTGTDAYDARYRIALFALEVLLMFVLVTWGAQGLVTSGSGIRLSAWRFAAYGVGGLILGNLLFDRLDLVVGALLLLSVLLLVRGSWRASFVLLAVAINFKVSPITLAPLWVVASLGPDLFIRARTQPGALLKGLAARALSLAGLAAAVFVPFVLTEGARSLDFLRFQAIRGVQIESVPASVLLVLHAGGLPAQVSAAFGAIELNTPLSPLFAAASPLLILIAAAVTVVAYARGATTPFRRHARIPTTNDPAAPADDGSLATGDPPRFLSAALATLLLTLVASKVLSPQYLIWLLPLVPLLDIGPARTRAFQVCFVVVCALSTAIFPYLYGRTLAREDPLSGGYLDPTLLGVGLLLVRNALMIWLTWIAVGPLLRTTSDDVGASGQAQPTGPTPS